MNDGDKTRVQTKPPGIAEENEATRVAQSTGNDQATRLASRPLRQTGDPTLNPTTRITGASDNKPLVRDIQPGALIKNRFLLVDELGKGGMGVVYSARDLVHEEAGESDSLIAIKLLSDNFKDHPEALRMLQQETKKSRGLAHPNIVTVYDFDRDDEMVYMTMELLSGQSLDAYLKEHQNQTSALKDVTPIMTDIAQGLMYAHKENIIHSDLKPSNIFLTEKGAKILDFGIARAAMQSDSRPQKTKPKTKNIPDSQTQTEEGDVFALTPSYASLEMFLGEPPDPRDDIYAFACICYQLLANQHPYAKRSAEEALQKGLKPKKIEGLKESQWQGLLNGLALKRKKRTASVSDFLNALLPRRKEPWKQASLVLIVFALLSVGYYFFRPTVIVEPSLFENPPPAAELEPAQQSVVNDALEVAEVHMMVGRLLNPPGSNALDEYRKVLEIHPYDRQAIAGLNALMDKLLERAQTSVDSGDLQHAREIIQEGLKIHPNHQALQALYQQLEPPTQ